jgi:hypothetical protein
VSWHASSNSTSGLTFRSWMTEMEKIQAKADGKRFMDM